MPEPMIAPTTSETPFRYVSDLCFSNETPLRSAGVVEGRPRAVYPPVVDERGNRFEAKSKAEETEYERWWVFGRPLAARLEEERGSSFESDNLRDEDMPEGEEGVDVCVEVGVEEARDASSRESRGCA